MFNELSSATAGIIGMRGSTNMSGSGKAKPIAKMVIWARREGSSEWCIRNDRFIAEQYKSYDAMKSEVEAQVRGWYAVEPGTQFKITEHDHGHLDLKAVGTELERQTQKALDAVATRQ